MKKHNIFPFVILLLAATLASCGEKHDEAEIKAALDELLPRSFELNEIYFGEGLPATTDQAEINAFYGTFAVNVKSLKYHPVDKSCGYTSIAEIMEATEEVYTESYAQYLYELAFDGISSDKEDMTETEDESAEAEEGAVGEGEIIKSGDAYEMSAATQPVVMLDVTASYARYMEQNGTLTVRLDLADDAIELDREYRTDELEITADRSDYVIVTVPTYKNNEYDQDVELKLIETADGWRLDTPTY